MAVSSGLNVLDMAQAREDIKVTNSHGFKKPPRYQYMMIAAGSERSGIMNNDLISRSELAEVVAKKINNPAIKSWLFAIINEIPTADTERRGEWIPDDYAYYHCSECGYEQDERECVSPYCPKCGAKMGGGEE